MSLLDVTFIGEVRGKLGSAVYSRNRSGAYVRSLNPSRPASTVSQQFTQNRLKQCVSDWKALSDSERLEWSNFSAQITRVRTGSFKHHPSGYNLFISSQFAGYALGFATFNVPAFWTSKFRVTKSTWSIDLSILQIRNTFSIVHPDTQSAAIIFASAPVAPHITFFKNRLRQMRVITDVHGTAYNFYSDYGYVFGSPPPAGKKVFFRTDIYNVYNCLKMYSFYGSVIAS